MTTSGNEAPWIRTLAHAVRRRWRARTVALGALGAAGMLVGAVAALLLLDMAFGMDTTARVTLRWLPLLLAASVFALTLRSHRQLRTDRSATLWLEEQGADPDHLLTTALEGDLSTPLGPTVLRRAERRAATISLPQVMPWRLRGPIVRAVAALGTATAILAVFPGGPAGAWSRWVELAGEESSGAGPPSPRATAATPEAAPPRFGESSLRLTPPPYTGLSARDVDLGGVVAALPGSVVDLRIGAGAGAVEAERLGVGRLAVEAEAADGGRAARARWTITTADRGVDLTLRPEAGGAITDRRVIALATLEDRPPEVALELPARDQVFATATGRVVVRARVTDDFGVGGSGLHWVRSSGSGESFSFEEGEWEWDDVSRRGDTVVGTLTLDLATTGLGPGDVLHLRAEAQDLNDVTGPGRGVSPTRLIRVATDETMSEVTTLVGFPIEREREPILSQRMIILLTERLLADADGLSDADYADRARTIADEQDRLRERIEEVMFVREAAPDEEHAEDNPFADLMPDDEAGPVGTLDLPGHAHDGSPILDVDPDLLVAFNAMWDAGRLLRQSEVRPSLPPQHVALERLQKLREADRVFARGRVTRPPLDLIAARGTGEVDEARPTARRALARDADPGFWSGEIEGAAQGLDRSEPEAGALRLHALASNLLSASDGSVEAGGLVARAADRLGAGAVEEARSLLAEAVRTLSPRLQAGAESPTFRPDDRVGVRYLTELGGGEAAPAESGTQGAGPVRPFVFATARYASGDWDSAPLVPSNLIHSLAQYTSLPVEEEGVIVDLSSPDLLGYPFVFLTGHLPVRLDEAETANLRRYVERGGFIFIDDHNHDIDGAFHRSVLSELARIFGADALQPLPESHALYRSFFVFDDGPPTTSHELSGWGDGLIHEELFAIERDGRIAVLYSNKDYASEWSYHAENKRFLALDNTRFGVNILLYALTR